MVRKITNYILEMLDQGILDKDQVIIACLNYMSEDEVRDMAECNDFLPEEDDSSDHEDECYD